MRADVGCGRCASYSPEFVVQVRDLRVHCSVTLAGDRLALAGITVTPPSDRALDINDLKSLPLVGIMAQAQREAPSLNGLTPNEQAAVVYRTALLFGRPPTAYVAEMLGVSKDAAAKRVQAARRAGLLGPTTIGKKAA